MDNKIVTFCKDLNFIAKNESFLNKFDKLYRYAFQMKDEKTGKELENYFP